MVYSPALLSIGSPLEVIQALITGVIAVVALGTVVQGFLITALRPWERVLAAFASVSLLHGDWESDVFGAILMALIVVAQWYRKVTGGPCN